MFILIGYVRSLYYKDDSTNIVHHRLLAKHHTMYIINFAIPNFTVTFFKILNDFGDFVKEGLTIIINKALVESDIVRKTH